MCGFLHRTHAHGLGLERVEIRLRRALGDPLDVSVMCNHPPSQLGQAGATAAGAAPDGLGHCGTESLLELLQQKPGLAKAHAHPDRGLAGRALLVDRLQQADLAGADGRTGIEVETDGEAGHAPN